MKTFKQILAELGCSSFAFASYRFGDEDGSSVRIGINNWDVELLLPYRDTAPMLRNPVFARLRKTVVPTVVARAEVIDAEADEECRRVHESYADAGLEQIAFVPVRTSARETGSFTISGPRRLRDCELASLAYISQMAFERMSTKAGAGRAEKRTLSDREKDCLILTSRGLNSLQVGTELGISAHTVNYHINNVCRKLSAANKTHALSIALRDGHISI